jgi:photosystem II stability/assembly factor-like uncharacterized protein
MIRQAILILLVLGTLIITPALAQDDPTPAPPIALGEGVELVPHPGAVSLYAVDFVSEEDGWAAGTGGTILHYEDGAWTLALEGQPGLNIRDMQMFEDEGWAVGNNERIGAAVWHYMDGVWTLEQTLRNVGPLTGLSMVDPDFGYAAGNTHLVRYEGEQWIATLEGKFTDVDMLGASAGVAVGEEGLMMRYDGGIWEPMEKPTEEEVDFLSVDFLTPDNGWVSGIIMEKGEIAPVVYRMKDGEWEAQEIPGALTVVDFAMRSTIDGWAVGLDEYGNGMIWQYDFGEWVPALELEAQATPTPAETGEESDEPPTPMIGLPFAEAISTPGAGNIWVAGSGGSGARYILHIMR